MTKKEIIEGNKLIAEFMTPLPKIGKEYGFKCIPNQQDELCKTFDNDLWWISENKLFYHSLWGWLMPVVDKIEHLYEDETSLPIFDINSHYSKFAIKNPQHKFKEWIVGAYLESPEKINANSKIEAAWMVCVNFIKWYNLNKNI